MYHLPADREVRYGRPPFPRGGAGATGFNQVARSGPIVLPTPRGLGPPGSTFAAGPPAVHPALRFSNYLVHPRTGTRPGSWGPRPSRVPQPRGHPGNQPAGFDELTNRGVELVPPGGRRSRDRGSRILGWGPPGGRRGTPAACNPSWARPKDGQPGPGRDAVQPHPGPPRLRVGTGASTGLLRGSWDAVGDDARNITNGKNIYCFPVHD